MSASKSGSTRILVTLFCFAVVVFLIPTALEMWTDSERQNMQEIALREIVRAGEDLSDANLSSRVLHDDLVRIHEDLQKLHETLLVIQAQSQAERDPWDRPQSPD